MATGAAVAAGPLDPQGMLSRFGAWAVLVLVFAETGLPVIGVFLPGDTLLLPAGLACSPGALGVAGLSLPLVLLCAGLGSLAGAQTGFWLGRRGARSARGRWSEGRGRARMERAEALFARYGPRRAVLLGRFVPVVRTLVHPAAGLLGMPTTSFTLWQAVAGLAWSQSLVLAGYALGESERRGSTFLLPAIALVVAVGLLPPVMQWCRARRARKGVATEADLESVTAPPQPGAAGQVGASMTGEFPTGTDAVVGHPASASVHTVPAPGSRWTRWIAAVLLMVIPAGYLVISALQSHSVAAARELRAEMAGLVHGAPSAVQRDVYRVPIPPGASDVGFFEANSWRTDSLYVQFTTTPAGLKQFLARLGTRPSHLRSGLITVAIPASQTGHVRWSFPHDHRWAGIALGRPGPHPAYAITANFDDPQRPAVFVVSTISFSPKTNPSPAPHRQPHPMR
jgi:membrane-associated protein